MNKHSKYKLTSAIKFISHRDPKAREANLQKAREAKPSKCLHNSATIHWLNKRYGRNLVDKRVLSLLPNNGIPVENKCNSPEMKKRNKFKSWFKTYCHPKDKFEKLEINPKYLFTSETFKKILQLREIFLEFDEDGSRKMEVDEMVEMFHKNNLFVSADELINLFFSGKKIPSKSLNNLYLDFNQFIDFALNKDQEFREFMRKIRSKYCQIEGTKNEMSYIPMNFDLVLDYFIEKGKERASKKMINQSIEVMDKMIKIVKNNTKKGAIQKPFDYSLLNALNYDELIREFSKLFKLNSMNGKNNKNTNDMNEKINENCVRFFSPPEKVSNISNHSSNNNLSHESLNNIINDIETERIHKKKRIKIKPNITKKFFTSNNNSIKKESIIKITKDNTENSTTLKSKILSSSMTSNTILDYKSKINNQKKTLSLPKIPVPVFMKINENKDYIPFELL